MNRRGFLKFLAAAAPVIVAPGAAAALVEEILKPRTIFLPPAGGWRSGNQLLTCQWVAREALRVLHADMKFSAQINREYSALINQMHRDWSANDGRIVVNRPWGYAR